MKETLPQSLIFFAATVDDTVSVRQGKYVEVPPGSNVTSSGFRICNVVMIRNERSGRLVFYHYWEAQDFTFGKLDQILETFDPKSVEVVIFGNQGSTSLNLMERHLRTRARRVKSYEVQEKSRWEFIYNQGTDQILYNGTDSRILGVISDVFGKEAAARSTLRSPEYDFRLKVQMAVSEIDKIASKLSFVVNDLVPPSDLDHLPHSEKELRLLWLVKNRELVSMLPQNSEARTKAEKTIFYQEKILIEKFGVRDF